MLLLALAATLPLADKRTSKPYSALPEEA